VDGPTHVEKLGNDTKMAAEVALCPLWNAFAALKSQLVSCVVSRSDEPYPGDQDVLGQRRVGVLDLDEGKLDAAI
jgi:hypothetical protein